MNLSIESLAEEVSRLRSELNQLSANSSRIAGNALEYGQPGGIQWLLNNGIFMVKTDVPSFIPPGWHICDGTHGTLDLRDQFIVGAGSSFSTHATGGTTDIPDHPADDLTHDHNHDGTSVTEHVDHDHNARAKFETAAGSGGFHAWQAYDNVTPGQVDYDKTFPENTNLVHTVTQPAAHSDHGPLSHDPLGDGNTNLPPFYALYFIQKIGGLVDDEEGSYSFSHPETEFLN